MPYVPYAPKILAYLRLKIFGIPTYALRPLHV